MSRFIAPVLFLLLCSPLQAQVRVKGAASYRTFDPIVLTATGGSGKAQYLWDVTSISGSAQAIEAGGTLYVWATPGFYSVRLTAIDFEGKKVERATYPFKVEGDVPVPPDPGPGPGPKPKPPSPGGPVKVLILEDAKARTQLSQARLSILFGLPMRTYLNKVCATDPGMDDGKAWTVQDKDTDLSALGAFWESARRRPRAGLPWIVIADQAGTIIFEGDLPADVPSTQALIGKYVTTQRRKAG
jgi:hypothetical protein